MHTGGHCRIAALRLFAPSLGPELLMLFLQDSGKPARRKQWWGEDKRYSVVEQQRARGGSTL